MLEMAQASMEEGENHCRIIPPHGPNYVLKSARLLGVDRRLSAAQDFQFCPLSVGMDEDMYNEVEADISPAQLLDLMRQSIAEREWKWNVIENCLMHRMKAGYHAALDFIRKSPLDLCELRTTRRTFHRFRSKHQVIGGYSSVGT